MQRRYVIMAAMLLAQLVAGSIAPSLVRAEEPSEKGWTDVAEFAYVATAGNAESSTFGFKNTLGRAWDSSSITIKAGGVRADSTTVTRTAFGTPMSFTVDEASRTDVSAESYYLNGRYDRKITERFFWYAGAGWDRNRPSGIDNRYIVEGGVGNIWRDDDRVKFRTSYAVSYTDQEDRFTDPSVSDTFAGLRAGWDYLHKFGGNTTYINTLVVDENLDETSDWRADMVNSVAVSMSERLALKVSLQWLYDNEPSLVGDIPLFDVPGPGGVQNGTVLIDADDLDTIFTASLVVNF